MKKSVMLVLGVALLLMGLLGVVSALPDLTISGLEKIIDNQIYNEGQLLVMNFCYKNIGTTNSEVVSIGVSYFINNLSTESGTLESGKTEILSPGEEKKCGLWPMYYPENNFSLSFLDEGDSVTFRFTLNPESKMEESNEMNNIKEVSYSSSDIKKIKETEPLTEEEILEQIRQRNELLKPFLITEDIGDWVYHPGEVFYNQSSPCLSEKFIWYGATYLKAEFKGARVYLYDFPSEIENTAFLNSIIKCLVSQDLNFKIKKSGENSYFYAETQGTSTLSDGSTRAFTDAHYVWYNGNKIVYILLEKGYIVQDLLTAYFDKYPSQVVAPPGLIQRILDFFKRLFGR